MIAEKYRNLQAFYASAAGQFARRLIIARLHAIAPPPTSRSSQDPRLALGIGYTTPFLPTLTQYIPQTIQFQLGTPLADDETTATGTWGGTLAMTDETLPLLAASIDLVMMVHAMESADGEVLLSEIWRVLTGDGVLIAVVAHRPSGWEKFFTPKHYGGQAYTATRLGSMLKNNGFSVDVCQPALIVPPMAWSLYTRLAKGGESLPSFLGWLSAGVIVVVARKTVYAPRLKPGFAWARQQFMPMPATAPAA